jgi:Flp pilus assembly protein CpaB
MRRGRRTMLLLGTVLALLAFVVLYLALSRSPDTSSAMVAPTPVPKQQVVVTANDVKSFTIVKDTDLTIKEVEQPQVLTATTEMPELIVGKMLVRDYKADAQVVMTDVADAGISQVLKKGERAFVLPIKEIDYFGGDLVDGDVVDVLWTRTFEVTTNIPGADGKPTQLVKPLPTTKKILDNIKVLRVTGLGAAAAAKNSSTSGVNAQGDSSSGDSSGKAAQTAAAQALYGKDAPFTAALTLAINDQQAEVIKYARETGDISLALRPKDDAEVQRTTGITDKIMNEDYGVILPEVLIK